MSGETQPFSQPEALDLSDYPFLILVDRVYPEISQALLDTALDRLVSYWKVPLQSISVVVLPTPQAMLCYLSRILHNGTHYAGALVLGCILKSADPECFAVYSHEVAAALMSISCRYAFPFANEILTLYDLDQAPERFCKGAEGADALVEMAVLCRSLSPMP